MTAAKVGTLVTALLNAGYFSISIFHAGQVNGTEDFRVSTSGGVPVKASDLQTFASSLNVTASTGTADFT